MVTTYLVLARGLLVDWQWFSSSILVFVQGPRITKIRACRIIHDQLLTKPLHSLNDLGLSQPNQRMITKWRGGILGILPRDFFKGGCHKNAIDTACHTRQNKNRCGWFYHSAKAQWYSEHLLMVGRVLPNLFQPEKRWKSQWNLLETNISTCNYNS